MSVVYATVNGRLVQENLGGVVTRFVADTLGSVIQTRDASGNQTSLMTYWPFGEVRSSSGTNPSPWWFCGVWGYLRDAATRLYVRARYYRPRESRWNTLDPLWPDESPYGYADADPVGRIDPSGMQSRGCPHHGGEPGCVFNGPPGSESDPAYWHCQTPMYDRPVDYGFWDDGFWGYGNCCGPNRKCGPGSKTYSCTDAACKAHDTCVGSSVIGGIINWIPCNKKFCNDIKFCWNRSCAKSPYDSKQCAAISDIAKAFCNSFGGGPPGVGNIWPR